ncbi:CynX/NimT family MFS transporter [Azohydromonas sediminis]|uniref:MFS transporter n=1 Tax=Azohydromonas sediminis TaxID=2259674 RepID=UPI000E653D0A|nr:MFS transporter [Azohydromonas sediminis]
MTAAAPRDPRDEDAALRAALIVIAAGVGGALHVGKLPPAIAALQQALGLTLVQAGFLLSLVQFAGMALGVAFGVLADGLGLKRSMVLGLAVLALASAAGGAADGVAALMALRAIEGFGFLLVALPAPGLIRQLVPPQRVSLMLGLWGAYMPLATALALLAGPLAIAAFGWRPWWGLLAAVSALAAVVVARAVPAPPPPAGGTARGGTTAWTARLAHTLGARGPWLVALAFAMYSGQWLAVIGFLPTIYTAAGVAAGATGLLTALAAGVNTLGNVAAGRLLHRGAPQPLLLAAGYVAMALAAALAFAGPADGGAPPWLRYVAVLAFSMLGGMIPATLFSLAVRLAPGEHTLSTTVGWVQQWSSFGQFAGPPLVAWVASRAGGWHWTWAVTGACSLAGLALVAALRREIAAAPTR